MGSTVSVSRSSIILFISAKMRRDRTIDSTLLKHVFTLATAIVYVTMVAAAVGLAWVAWVTATGRPLLGETMVAVRGSIGLPLLIGLVCLSGTIHELGHAVAAWAEGVSVPKSGVMFAAVVPLGFFVKIDDDELFQAPVSSQMRILSGGIAANVAMILGAVAVLVVGESASMVTMMEAVTQTPTELGHVTWVRVAWGIIAANSVIIAFNALPLALHDGGHLLRLLIHGTIDVPRRQAVDVWLSLIIVPCVAFTLFAGYVL